MTTPRLREYLQSIQMRYSEVSARELRQGDMLIMPRSKSGNPEITGIRVIHIDDATYTKRSVTIQTNEEKFELDSAQTFPITSSVPNLIGRKVLDCQYKVVGQRPINGLPSDDHLVVLLMMRENPDPPPSMVIPLRVSGWATILYNDRTGSFFEGGYDLTYIEAMDDFSTRK